MEYDFVIVGAGPTGVELAGAIAELRNKILPKDFPDLDFSKMKIHLIEASSRVLVSMGLKSSEKAHDYLNSLNVNVYTETFVENFSNNVVSTSRGKEFKCDTFIWAAGVSATFPNGTSPKSKKCSACSKTAKISTRISPTGVRSAPWI